MEDFDWDALDVAMEEHVFFKPKISDESYKYLGLYEASSLILRKLGYPREDLYSRSIVNGLRNILKEDEFHKPAMNYCVDLKEDLFEEKTGEIIKAKLNYDGWSLRTLISTYVDSYDFKEIRLNKSNLKWHFDKLEQLLNTIQNEEDIIESLRLIIKDPWVTDSHNSGWIYRKLFYRLSEDKQVEVISNEFFATTYFDFTGMYNMPSKMTKEEVLADLHRTKEIYND